jgi:hypothetical protein
VDFTSFNPLSISSINDNEVVAFGNMTSISNAIVKSPSSDRALHWKFDNEGKAVYFRDTAAYTTNQS